MTIEEMRENKKELELKVAQLLTQFTRETGLIVDSVDFFNHGNCNSCEEIYVRMYEVSTDVKLI